MEPLVACVVVAQSSRASRQRGPQRCGDPMRLRPTRSVASSTSSYVWVVRMPTRAGLVNPLGVSCVDEDTN